MSNHDLNLGTVSPAVANMINRGETTVHRSHDLPRNIERDLIDLLVKLLDGEYSRSEIIDVLVALLKGGDLDRSDLVELLSACSTRRARATTWCCCWWHCCWLPTRSNPSPAASLR